MPETIAISDLTALDLESMTADVVAMAMKAGASDAEAVAREGDEFSVNVRLGQVETLKESGSRALGLRVFLGKRTASASTSDLTPDGIRQLVDGAMALVKVTEEDPFTGMPEREELGALEGDLRLYFDDVYSLPGPERIEWARRAEAAAMAAALTRLRVAKGWRIRADLSAATEQAMRASLRLRWPWMQTAPCSGMAGGAAHGASRFSNHPNLSVLKPRGAQYGSSVRDV
jgi:PmbA/TldA metallopeptidase domain 1